MHRVLALFAAVALMLGSGLAIVAAQQPAIGTTELSDGVTLTTLAVAEFDALPVNADAIIFTRLTIGPTPPEQAAATTSARLMVIESGTVTLVADGAMTVPYVGDDGPERPEAGTELTLSAGDSGFFPSCSTETLANAGPDPVTFLMGFVDSFTDPEPCPGSNPDDDDEEDAASEEVTTVGFIDLAEITPLPALPATLAIGRLTYESGAADPEPAANAGTTIAFVETGTFGFTMVSGNSVLTRKSTDPDDPFAGEASDVVADTEVLLEAGDSVAEVSGTVSSARNAGDGDASVLVLVLVAAAAEGEPTPTS